MTSPTIADLGEWNWLSKVRQELSGPPRSGLVVGIGDDAAVWKPAPGSCWVATCDAHAEGTHFESSWLNWAGLARRSLLAAASDISAMGGVPKGFLISLGVPAKTRLADLEEFTEEVIRLAHRYDLWPMGGDTFRSDRIVLDVTALGVTAEGDTVLQTGANPGDSIWVTGQLGTMRAAWTCLGDEQPGEEELRKRFWDPPVRWTILPELRRTLPIRAMTDLSDGLSRDLRKILDREGLGAEIELDRLPIDPIARKAYEDRGLSALESAYAGGEDYELLVVESGYASGDSETMVDGVPLTRIGRVTDGPGTVRTSLNGEEIQVRVSGFEHF